MTTITNGSPTQPLPPVAPPNESGSSLQLLTFTRYVQNHPDLSRLLQEDMQWMAQDICLLVNGWLPKEEDLPSALHQTAGLVKTAVADLLSKKKPISALTIQKIHEIDKIAHAHATRVLYDELREQRLIPGEPSSDVEVQRTAIAAVNVAGVTKLNLSNKRLRCVPREIGRFTALQKLNLSYNYLTSLPPGIFDNLTALKELTLDNNQFTSLPPGIFDGLTALETLYLSHNLLLSLPAKIFDSLTALETLYLEHNLLSGLPAKIFDSLTALEILNLSHNQLTSLHAKIFDHLTTPADLSLSSNQINRLPKKTFDYLSALESLLFDNNHTSLLDECFDKLIALKWLNLEGNQFIRLSSRLFANLTALQTLCLRNHHLEEIPPLPSRVEVYD